MFKCCKKINEIKKNFISLISQKSTKMIFLVFLLLLTITKGEIREKKRLFRG